MAASGTSPFVAALALVVLVLVLPCSSAADHTVPDRGHGRGARFMDWVARELPVVVLKSVECVKKNQRELSAALLALFSDVGKCFDDAKGSVLSTAECLLRNSMARMINTVSTAHKIIDCLGYGRNGRLCVSVSNVKDEQCPLLVGV